MFLKNAEGKQSASLTMMAVSFFVITLWVVLSMFEQLGPLKIRPFAGADAMLYLSPVMMLYFGRKGQDSATSTGTDSSPIAAVLPVAT